MHTRTIESLDTAVFLLLLEFADAKQKAIYFFQSNLFQVMRAMDRNLSLQECQTLIGMKIILDILYDKTKGKETKEEEEDDDEEENDSDHEEEDEVEEDENEEEKGVQDV